MFSFVVLERKRRGKMCICDIYYLFIFDEALISVMPICAFAFNIVFYLHDLLSNYCMYCGIIRKNNTTYIS